jgi:hypothetical protein
MVGQSKYFRRGHSQKSDAAAARTSQAEGSEISASPKRDPLDVLITLVVRGKPSPFPVDPKFKWKGGFEATFEAGDKQILLWAIEDCAQRGVPIPEWAGNALHQIMFHGVARGNFASWEDAFGPIRVMQQRTIKSLQHMADVWKRIRERREQDGCPIDDLLFEDISKEFGIGIGKVKEYYGKIQRVVEENPDVWN